MLVRDVADIGMTEERKGVVFAEGVEGDRALDHLADLAIGTTRALGGKRGDQLGVALVAFGRVEHRSQVAVGRLDGARGVERHPERLQDLRDVSLEPLPVGVADSARADPFPIVVLDIFVAECANACVEIPGGHQFGCRVCSDRRTSICPFCIRVS